MNGVKRTAVLTVIMLCICGALITRAAYLQIVKGEEYAQAASRRIQYLYNENASRGSIFDKNGQPMVTNEMAFEIVFNYLNWDTDKQNSVILELCELMSEYEQEHFDSLPLNGESPFSYTYQSLEDGDAKRLVTFIAKQKNWPKEVSAPQLFDLLCEKYKVDKGLTPEQKRLIIGVRYEMQRREFSSNNPYTFAEKVDMQVVSIVSERNVTFPGAIVQVNDLRKYDTAYAAHILGRVGLMDPEEYKTLKEQGYPMNAYIGKDGMEKSLEQYLRSIDGKRAVSSDDRGNILSNFMQEEPQPGDNCFLTIDLELQRVAEESLAKTMQGVKANAKKERSGEDAEGGAAVVIDVNTGAILALANYPSYSLSSFNTDYSSILQNGLKPLFNRAIAGEYPPGSTFKMATAIAALEEKVVTPTSRIRDQGVYRFYEDYTPACWIYRKNGSTHGSINISQAIKYSCNYFFYEVSRILGIERLNKYATELGLGQKTGVELAGEQEGNLAGPESRAKNGGATWYGGETLMAGIGQSEQQFTPIQLCSYVATIANGGTRYRPHLLGEVKNYSNTESIMVVQPEVAGKINMSDSTQKAVFEGMLGVTSDDGTASSIFRNFPIEVGGKTGSAQTVIGKRSDHGVFVSFAPYDNPQIAVCVIGEYAGTGGNMAPVAVEIYKQYFNLNDGVQNEQ